LSNCKYVSVELDLSNSRFDRLFNFVFAPSILGENFSKIKKNYIGKNSFNTLLSVILSSKNSYSSTAENVAQPAQWALSHLGSIKVIRKPKALILSCINQLELLLSNSHSFLLNCILNSLTYKPTQTARLTPFIYFP